MPKIRYKAQNFDSLWGPHLTGVKFLTVTWEELVWSAMTVGKPGLAQLFTHGWHSLSDLIVRTHTVYANLRQTPLRYVKSNLYDSLDPTEKGATSYFMGMMASKLIAARLLDTPWLFHLSAFNASGGTAILNGNSHPDMIGLNSRRRWIVVEAKGRTNGFDAMALNKAKSQTRSLGQINGQNPVLRVAVQAFFSPNLELVIEDPDDFDDNALDIIAEKGTLLNKYYSFAHSVTEDSKDVRIVMNHDFLFHQFDDLGLSIGIDRRLSESMGTQKFLQIVDSLQRPSDSSINSEGGVTVFPDGIAIGLDERWSKDNMNQEPENRE